MKIPLYPLKISKFSTVNAKDFCSLIPFKWHIQNRNGLQYAIRYWRKGRKHSMLMHRQILGISDSRFVDHRDRNGLNNLRSNLRPCNRSQNGCNRKLNKNNKSGFKGVAIDKKSGRWMARIVKNRKIFWLGLFNSPRVAAMAYNRASKKIHGKFGRPNVV